VWENGAENCVVFKVIMLWVTVVWENGAENCVVYKVILLWVTVVWENGAENSGMGALMCMTKVAKNDAQLWLMNSFKSRPILAWKTSFHDIRTFWRISTNFEDCFVSNYHGQIGLPYVLCMVGSKTTDWLGCITWLHRSLKRDYKN
jgi:hypothetical protein